MARTKNTTLKDMAAYLGGTLKGLTITGSRHDIPFTCRYSPQTRNSPSMLIVTLNRNYPQAIVIRRESKADALAKNIGLACEVQTGDPEFDNSFYVNCASPSFARQLLFNHRAKEIYKELYNLDKQITSALVRKNLMQVVISPVKLDSKSINGPLAAGILELMAELSDLVATQAFSSPVISESSDRFGLIKALLYIISFGSLAVGAVSMIFSFFAYPLLEGGLFFRSLLFSIPALILFLYLSFNLVKGRSSSGAVFALILFISLAGFIMSGFGIFRFTNSYFDASPEKASMCAVTKTHYNKGKNSTTYYVRCEPQGLEGVRSADIQVDYDFYISVKPGETIVITTKPGRWGYEWLLSYSKAAKSEETQQQ